MRPMLAALAIALTATPALAQERTHGYCTQISARDKVSSRGAPLSSGAQMIRQDRANYHRFGRRDGMDEPDALFADPGMRAWLEANIRIDPTYETILRRHEPWGCVILYGSGGRPDYAVFEVPG